MPASVVRNVDDAFADLELLLGETVTKLFTVKAHYRQSLFPENNFITVESRCQIKRPNPLSSWSISPPKDIFYALRAEAELYKRFVFLVATQDPPLVALETLATFYENKRCSLPCSGYIERVRTELLHQLEAQTPVPSVMSVRNGPSTPTQSQHSTPEGLATPRHIDAHQPRHYLSHPHFSFSPRDSLRFTARKPPTPTPQTVQRASSASPVLLSIAKQPPQPSSPCSTARFIDTPLPSSAAMARGAASAVLVASGSPGGSGLNLANSSADGAMMLTSVVDSPKTATSASSSPIDEARAIWRHMRRNVSMRGRTTAASGARNAVPSWPAGYRRSTVVAGEAVAGGGDGGGGARVHVDGDVDMGLREMSAGIGGGCGGGSWTSSSSSSLFPVISPGGTSTSTPRTITTITTAANTTTTTTPSSTPTAAAVGRALVRERRERREREWKRKALLNKRSLGADTLRSLAMGGELEVGAFDGEGW
ncbi:uncharacterized protein J3D65DRAFT_601797 [Phyllosticta citribraziliensis]|uniref:RGS domain-containing protein n=1 Tax=Phyllosticta citribraziliensis TaxID=989973 RepID=A0ABR1LX43_9PEZI